MDKCSDMRQLIKLFDPEGVELCRVVTETKLLSKHRSPTRMNSYDKPRPNGVAIDGRTDGFRCDADGGLRNKQQPQSL